PVGARGLAGYRSPACPGAVHRDHGLRAVEKASGGMTERQSTITCPACGHQQTETMPTDACWFFYDCMGCRALLRPEPGDCCVFCTYGTVPCPPAQEARHKGERDGRTTCRTS